MLYQTEKPSTFANIQVLSIHSAVGHDLNPAGLIHCGIVLGDTEFMYIFIGKNYQKS